MSVFKRAFENFSKHIVIRHVNVVQVSTEGV